MRIHLQCVDFKLLESSISSSVTQFSESDTIFLDKMRFPLQFWCFSHIVIPRNQERALQKDTWHRVLTFLLCEVSNDNSVHLTDQLFPFACPENYKEMQALYEKLKSKGFVVLAFPCNQFGAQEPDACPVIQKNMQNKFGVSFPMFDKVDVNGANTCEVYKTLKAALPGDISWNFEKFLVDKEGKPVKRFKSSWSSSVEEEVEKLL